MSEGLMRIEDDTATQAGFGSITDGNFRVNPASIIQQHIMKFKSSLIYTP
jgi:hypothetical protein